MDGPYSWTWRPSNYIVSRRPTNTTIQVIGTKPMLKWSAMILYLKPWVTWSKSSIYKFVKVNICFTFEHCGFLERRTLNYRIQWATFNMLLAMNINNFLQLQATLRYQRYKRTGTRRSLLHAYIFDNIGFNSKNSYSWTKKIHTVSVNK